MHLSLTSRGAAPGFVTIDVANALVLLGYGLTWTGARIFDSRPIRPFLVLLAPLTWILLCRIPVFADSAAARIIFVSTALALLAPLTAQEFCAPELGPRSSFQRMPSLSPERAPSTRAKDRSGASASTPPPL